MVELTQMQQQATEYLERGQYGEASALYEQCIAAEPTLMSNYWHLGLAWLLMGEESEARAIWLSALMEGTPEQMDGWMVELLEVLETEAIRYLDNRNFQLAIEIYWQILELDSQRAEAHYNLGNALAQQGNFDEAVACWQQAIDLKPDFAEAYQNQGGVFQKLKEFAAAIACYLKILEIKPDEVETLYNLGLCLSHEDRWDDAIACFQKAIQIQPEYAPAYGDWGNALLVSGQLNEAIACLQKAIQSKPDFARAYCRWRDTLAKLGGSNEAIDSNAKFLQALQSQPNAVELYLSLANVLLRANQWDIAILSYQQSLNFQPESAEIYGLLGKALAGKGEVEEAIATFQKAIKLQTESTELYFNLGKVLARRGNFEEAIAAFQKVLELNSELPDVYSYLGNAFSAIGAWNEAIACYRNQLEFQPDSVEVYCNLGIALAQLDKAEEAVTSFHRVLEINPDFAEVIDDAVAILRRQGKLDEDTVSFQQVLPIDPPIEFYESTEDWAVASNLPTRNYITIFPKNNIFLTPPKTPDRTIHFSFRFGNNVELPATFVAIVPDGRYWLNDERGTSAIVNSDNQLLADVSPEFPALSPGHPDKHPRNHSIFSLKKLPPFQRIEGTVAVLSGLSNHVYFHWMLDILPRVELLHRSGIKIAEVDKFLIGSRLPFQKETLNALGIAESKILETDKYSHVQATKLVVPSLPGSLAWMPKWACDFLRSRFLDKKALEASEKIERLYISRSEAANRRIVNEDEVINLLNQFGFKSVTLESMTVIEQAALLHHANVVVAPHGGGLTNLVFCRPGTKVIEIFSPYYVYHCYWLISNLVGLDYYYLLGEASEGLYLHKLLYPSSRIEDIFVNLNALLNLIKFAGIN